MRDQESKRAREEAEEEERRAGREEERRREGEREGEVRISMNGVWYCDYRVVERRGVNGGGLTCCVVFASAGRCRLHVLVERSSTNTASLISTSKEGEIVHQFIIHTLQCVHNTQRTTRALRE